jgi:hypothetical protein
VLFLSKAPKVSWFSEDIDIRIEPPEDQDVKTGRNHLKEAHIRGRKDFYDWLARTIKINGITRVERDRAFDNKDLFSAGIRLHYESIAEPIEDLRDGVLLEAGFAKVTPNAAKDISSWAYDYAVGKVDIIDNQAKAVACYDPGYTLVEKLQTISTKFRKQQETGELPSDFMRHYYDVHSLLRRPEVQAFIGTEAYKVHKRNHFPKADNQDIAANEAFLLSDAKTRAAYAKAYTIGSALYYGDRPTFEQVLNEISTSIDRL